tara:strand:- start:84 stop:614 length:531 start_codon:yes stop_codon:yes gene_type:complete
MVNQADPVVVVLAAQEHQLVIKRVELVKIIQDQTNKVFQAEVLTHLPQVVAVVVVQHLLAEALAGTVLDLLGVEVVMATDLVVFQPIMEHLGLSPHIDILQAAVEEPTIRQYFQVDMEVVEMVLGDPVQLPNQALLTQEAVAVAVPIQLPLIMENLVVLVLSSLGLKHHNCHIDTL